VAGGQWPVDSEMRNILVLLWTVARGTTLMLCERAMASAMTMTIGNVGRFPICPQRLKDFQQARRNTHNVFSGEASGKRFLVERVCGAKAIASKIAVLCDCRLGEGQGCENS
jgi:hypothetical protein